MTYVSPPTAVMIKSQLQETKHRTVFIDRTNKLKTLFKVSKAYLKFSISSAESVNRWE